MLQTEVSGFGGHIQEKPTNLHIRKLGFFFEREPIYLSDMFGEYPYIIKMSFKNKDGQVVENMKNAAC